MLALEINLRKGGTTHPYVVLCHLVPGKYDPEAGAWKASDGTQRWYWATDNLIDESWLGLAPDAVIRAIAAEGLQLTLEPGPGSCCICCRASPSTDGSA